MVNIKTPFMKVEICLDSNCTFGYLPLLEDFVSIGNQFSRTLRDNWIDFHKWKFVFFSSFKITFRNPTLICLMLEKC